MKEVRSDPLLRTRKESVYKATERGRTAFDGYFDSMERRLEKPRVAAATAGQ